jgi:hypothetical protein
MGVCAIFWFEIDGNMKNDGLFYLYSGYWILDIGYVICVSLLRKKSLAHYPGRTQ